jgi:LruC domain-containing protein
VHEGAGWKNVFGFYTYTLGNAPQSANEIENLTIIFPNSSYEGSGGGLYSGDKVYIGEFPENTVIAWFLVAQAWKNEEVTNGAYTVYSDKWLNPETNQSLQQHSVLLLDESSNRYIIGFEDINREYTSCDNDFNDVVFFASVSPEDAVDNDGIETTEEQLDSDGDGVTDEDDDYPLDEKRAFDNFSHWATLAFEDLWPAKGDYDFNDLVLSYQVNQVTNAQNMVVELKNDFSIRAIGAGFENGFAVQFPISPEQIDFVEGGVFSPENYFLTGQNGTELGQTKAVVPIFDNAKYLFETSGMINVYPNVAFVEPDTFTVFIHFANPQLMSDLGPVPFNPFLIKDMHREIEIHLPNKLPTDLASLNILGTGDDDSDLSISRTYLTEDNKPWAINIAGEFYHPVESVDIVEAYLKFAEWASSNGTFFPDWYLNIDGYTEPSKIYPHP